MSLYGPRAGSTPLSSRRSGNTPGFSEERPGPRQGAWRSVAATRHCRDEEPPGTQPRMAKGPVPPATPQTARLSKRNRLVVPNLGAAAAKSAAEAVGAAEAPARPASMTGSARMALPGDSAVPLASDAAMGNHSGRAAIVDGREGRGHGPPEDDATSSAFGAAEFSRRPRSCTPSFASEFSQRRRTTRAGACGSGAVSARGGINGWMPAPQSAFAPVMDRSPTGSVEDVSTMPPAGMGYGPNNIPWVWHATWSGPHGDVEKQIVPGMAKPMTPPNCGGPWQTWTGPRDRSLPSARRSPRRSVVGAHMAYDYYI
eukprot:TRINITY_DN21260_c0_g1_i1.p1 TRINITY_DN21260_c0_g1~~TRINITY_DN21260_c0_g1_i1.p1  ORF type:complete len:313 (+),score=29.05 TRINITY_DN21260_c0_g1_i1:105-1043(+)